MEFPEREDSAELNANAAPQAEADGSHVAGGEAAAGEAAAADPMAQQLAQAQAQAAEYLDQWRRATADFSNARKRMQREQADFQANANARLLEKLIPIVDDVDRAFAALPPEEADDEWVNGFRLIQ